ncbi:hypothetical protein [Microbulbifer halophilus]|uniref:hypothetical protein n=1 Tax=Microbulbifer halophilus TaxID=453963 RepID=UPI00361669A1
MLFRRLSRQPGLVLEFAELTPTYAFCRHTGEGRYPESGPDLTAALDPGTSPG